MIVKSRQNLGSFCFISLAATACLAVGCHTGSISHCQLSTDEQALAFRESNGLICIADDRGVRAVSGDDLFCLSPSGKWLLLLKQKGRHKRGFEFTAGGHITFIDLTSRSEFKTALPCDIPSGYREFGNRADWWTLESKKKALDVPDNHAIQVIFTDCSEFYIGPIWRSYWKCYVGPRSSKWEQVLPEDIPHVTSDTSNSRSLKDCSQSASLGTPHAPLVQLPCDGKIARRTLWVRPDGSTLEVTRQNDVPVMIILAIPATIGLTAMAPVYDLIGIVACGYPVGTAGCCMLSGMMWYGAFEGLRVDAVRTTQAQIELQELIGRRKSKPVSSQPTTRPQLEP
jgi:hypothetical protein